MTARSLAAMACSGMLAATVFLTPSESSSLPDSSPTQSVILNITALDQHGDPVTDLTRDDFQIYDDGKPQAITAYVPGAVKPVAETSRPATVILFDLLNSNNLNREYISTFIVRALEPLEVADTVYLFLFTNRGEIYPVRGFSETPPTAYLPPTRGTAGVEAVGALPWTRQVRPLLDQAIQKVYGIRPMNDRDVGFRAATTFTGLTALQQAFSRVRGPKTIVWISSGVTNWPQYPHGCKDYMITEDTGSYLAGKCTSTCRGQTKCIDYEPFLQHFSAELSRSNTLVYTAEDLPTGAMPPDDRGSATDTLRQMADLTGGRMYTGTNTDKAINDALKNARGRYQVTIAAPAANGKHHKLRVTCARKGVRVEAPRGYWAAES